MTFDTTDTTDTTDTRGADRRRMAAQAARMAAWSARLAEDARRLSATHQTERRVSEAWALAEEARQIAEERQALAEELAGRQAAELARLETIIRHLPVGVVIAEAPGGRIMLSNAQTDRLWRGVFPAARDVAAYAGYGARRAADDQPYRAEEYPLVRALTCGEVVREEEMVIPRADGAMMTLLINAAPIRDPDGTIVAGVATLDDVTARREGERLREQFLATVSHELQTPLTAVWAGLGLLEVSAADRLSAGEAALLTNARRNAERLRAQIADLLAFNQLRAGILTLASAPLDLRAMVTDAFAAVHALLAQKGQRLEADLPVPLPVHGDARRLEQVLVNLLGNAHRHTPPGTRVAVSGRVAGDDILLTVRDDGPGIPPALAETIFERFAQAAGDEGGTGLGLTIARGLVELHGGALWVEGAPGPGDGAVFHLRLPRFRAGDGWRDDHKDD